MTVPGRPHLLLPETLSVHGGLWEAPQFAWTDFHLGILWCKVVTRHGSAPAA